MFIARVARVLILSKLTGRLPSVAAVKEQWSHLHGLILADPDFLLPGDIDIILGADIYGKIIEADLIKLNDH